MGSPDKTKKEKPIQNSKLDGFLRVFPTIGILLKRIVYTCINILRISRMDDSFTTTPQNGTGTADSDAKNSRAENKCHWKPDDEKLLEIMLILIALTIALLILKLVLLRIW